MYFTFLWEMKKMTRKGWDDIKQELEILLNLFNQVFFFLFLFLW